MTVDSSQEEATDRGDEQPSTIQIVVLESLNKAIHAVLSVDPDTASAFAGLVGKVYCIELTFPAVKLYLIPEPEGFTLELSSEQEPDVTLSGSIFAFAKLGGKGAASAALADGQVTMHGDAEAGQALQKILGRFDFDWEELIARVLGDTPARKAGNVIRSTADWADKTARYGQENLVDYLQEEKKVLVTEPAMERFSAAVKSVRADADRLEQRLQNLRRALDD